MTDHRTVPLYSTDDLGTQVYDALADLRISGSSTEGDLAFYLARGARTRGPVLDVGCGTGRISVPLAEAGLEVVGLDRSRPMLRLAERRRDALAPATSSRLSFIEADMEAFDLGRTFSLIVVPGRAFQFLLTSAAQRSALEHFRRHLAPGGELIIDMFDPRLDLCVPLVQPTAGLIDTITHPTTGQHVQVQRIERANDPVHQLLVETWRTTALDSSGDVIETIDESATLRWTYRWEMRHLVELAGLDVQVEYSDFHGSPPAYGREQVWVLGHRA